jgi:hypothetical protein
MFRALMGSAWPQRSLNLQLLRHVEPVLCQAELGDIRTQAIMFCLPDREDFQHVGDLSPQCIALLPGSLALSLYLL